MALATLTREQGLKKWGWDELPGGWNSKLLGQRPLRDYEIVQIKKEKTPYYQQQSLKNFKISMKYDPVTYDEKMVAKWNKHRFNVVDMEYEWENTKIWTDQYAMYMMYGDQQYRLLDKSNANVKLFEELKAKYIALEKDDASLWIQVSEKLIPAIGSCKELEKHIDQHGKIIVLPSVKLSSLEMPERKESSKVVIRTVGQVDEQEFYEQKEGESRTQYRNRIKEYERTKREYDEHMDEITRENAGRHQDVGMYGEIIGQALGGEAIGGPTSKKETQRQLRRDGIKTSVSSGMST